MSDYSRYLPPDVTVRRTFYWTYGGSAVGGAWMMIIGSVLFAWKSKTRHLDIDAEIKVADQEVQELEKAALEGTL